MAAGPDDARERVERGDGHGHGSRLAAGPGREDGRRNRGADGEAGESEREWTVERWGGAGTGRVLFVFVTSAAASVNGRGGRGVVHGGTQRACEKKVRPFVFSIF